MPNPDNSFTRDQLAKFLPDQRTIRAFENLIFTQNENVIDIGDLTRDIQLNTIIGANAATAATEALSRIQMISDDLMALVSSREPSDHLSPRLDDTQALLASALIPPSVTSRDITDNMIGTPAAGHTYIYDATLKAWRNAALTAGTNVSITNGDGSISIAVTGAPPSGAAGGVLSGTYPNPGFAVDMATQAELDAHTTATGTAVHGLGTASTMTGPSGTIVGTTDTQTLTNKSLTSPIVTGTMDLQGGQIAFPATQVPSAGANTLDDYEEGTWTPTITATTGTMTTVVLTTANYTKIGRQVVANMVFTISVAGTGAGALLITLPFTNGAAISCGSGRENGLTGFLLQCYVNASSSTLNVLTYNNLSPIASGAQIRATITYFV